MSTSILNSLKLTAARKSRLQPVAIKRRNKLLQKLAEQRDLALALEQGQHYAPKRLRTLRDDAITTIGPTLDCMQQFAESVMPHFATH